MMLEQETQFLEPFFTRAQAGEIATVAEIHRAFEERIDHWVDEMVNRLKREH